MKVTIDTEDSKEEIVNAINLLQDALANKGINSYEQETPKQENEFGLGGLNFNDEPKVDNCEPSQEEVQELIRAQTTTANNPQPQPSQPQGAFGAMFGGEEKKDVFSNDDGFGSLDDSSVNKVEKKEKKDDDWGPRTKMTLGDLERY